ncbi:MAG TPA: uroporphyrinogen decarboxylase family protein [Anaerolineae bacterium]
MNSRQRVAASLAHRAGDRIPLDLGGCGQTGMHATTVYALRQALHLDPPGTPVKVIEPYQMLGEIAPDLQDRLGVDVVGLATPGTLFGFQNEDWKPWTAWDGTPLLVPGKFNTDPDEHGDLLMYVDGDRSAPPSAKMPNGGYYFDSLIRQEPIDDARLDPADNASDYGPIPAGDLAYLAAESERLYRATDRALMMVFGGAGFGDVALVPGPWVKHPRGIRDIAEWYMSTVTRQDYVKEVFERQCEVALANLPRVYDAVGDRVTVAWISGTDFGAQNGCLVSPRAFRNLFKPFYTAVNDWIHKHTAWKTFIHTCGSIQPLIPDIVEAGFDILNPVQTSAANMDPATLKARFGDRVTFWGGGVDTQHTLPFGTPDEVRQQVRARLEIFGRGGGFVFSTVHNVQANVPVENLLAMYETVRDYGGYQEKP